MTTKNSNYNSGFVVQTISMGYIKKYYDFENDDPDEGFFDNLVETFYVPTLEDANQIINILSKSRNLDEIKIHGYTSPEGILEDELWEN